MGTGRDSEKAAKALQEEGAGAVIVFGGDGTNRDVVKGWQDVPLIPLSVGTNNVFPFHMEATLGGIAAGLVAKEIVPFDEVVEQAKVIKVEYDNAERDLALVDLVLVSGDFIGSRAIWDVSNLQEGVFAIAESASVGLSSIAATLETVNRNEDAAMHVKMGEGSTSVRAPIAPGSYETIAVKEYKKISLEEQVTIKGPGVLAFDGERDRVLQEGETIVVSVSKEGPWVINTHRALDLANMNKHFVSST